MPNGQKGGGAPRLTKIYVRTMASDKDSIKNQGGGEPKPYQPNQGGSDNQQGQSNQPPTPPKPSGPSGGGGGAPTPPKSNDSSGGPGGGGSPKPQGPSSPGQSPGGSGQSSPGTPSKSGSGGPVGGSSGPSSPGGQGRGFPPGGPSQSGGNQGSGGGMDRGGQAGGPPSEPPQEFDTGDVSGDEFPPKKEKSSNKKLFIILLIIILALGAAVAVYFLLLAPSDAPAGDQQTQQEQATTTDDQQAMADESTSTEGETATETDDFSVPTVPESTSTDQEATGTDAQVPQGGQDDISADSHESLFSTAADSTTEITVSSLSLDSVMNALEFTPSETPVLREVVLQDSNNNLITLGELASLLSPNTFSDSLVESFEEDPTIFTYSDENGTWLGLVAQASSDADLNSVKSEVADLEDNVSQLSNYYFSSPGQAGSWSDGSAGGVTSRYITFSQDGAAFNYGWSGNTLVIGTSYSAFQAAVNRL